jgi:oligopeptide/dipeptide ABC transporter ATP-binding protein
VSGALVEVRNLVKHYPAGDWWQRGRVVRAVQDVSLEILRGETLALVGESGSGKSTVGRAVLRLEPPTGGSVHFDGTDLATTRPAALRRLRRRMQPVFQDPLGSLNPRRRIGDSLAEGLAIHRVLPPERHRDRVAELLDEVGLGAELANRWPHEFSQGQRQRLGIARALAVEPELLVCDEPVSALDVSVQAQVLNLLLTLRERRRLTYLFIAHDLAVVRLVSHRVAVMYLGTIVELGPAAAVIAAPRHPYTRALVSAVPEPDPTLRRERIVLQGDPPSPRALPTGCPFEPRCFHPARDAECRTARPPLVQLGERAVACHKER